MTARKGGEQADHSLWVPESWVNYHMPAFPLPGRGAATSQKFGLSIIPFSSFLPSFLPSPLLPPFIHSSLPLLCCCPTSSTSFPLSLHFSPFPLFSFSGVPPLEASYGKWSRQSHDAKQFLAFWGENRPLVSGESGVEEVYRRRTSIIITNHNDQNFWGVEHPNLIFWGCSRTPTTPTQQWLRHCFLAATVR